MSTQPVFKEGEKRQFEFQSRLLEQGIPGSSGLFHVLQSIQIRGSLTGSSVLAKLSLPRFMNSFETTLTHNEFGNTSEVLSLLCVACP